MGSHDACGGRSSGQGRTAWRWLTAGLLSVTAAVQAGGPPNRPDVPEGVAAVPYVYGGSLYDSNLFRTSGDQEAEAKLGTSDTSDVVSRVGTGLKAKLPVSLQTLRFDGWVERDMFSHFDSLNHTAADVSAAWDWEIGRLWSGTLDGGYSRELSSFDELQALEKDMKTRRQVSFDGGFRFLPNWEIGAGTGWRHTDHSSRDYLDRSVTSTFGALRYYTPYNTRVGLRASVDDGRYDHEQVLAGGETVNNDYTQTSYDLVIGWEGTSKSYLEGRFGYTKRHHQERASRDFTGITSQVDYLWQATAKTALKLSAWRDLRNLNDEVSSFVESRGVQLSPRWQATPKIRVRGALSAESRDFKGAAGTTSDNAGRKDDVREGSVGVDYEALRNLRLSLETAIGDRDSNVEDKDYRYEQVFAGASYAF